MTVQDLQNEEVDTDIMVQFALLDLQKVKYRVYQACGANEARWGADGFLTPDIRLIFFACFLQVKSQGVT